MNMTDDRRAARLGFQAARGTMTDAPREGVERLTKKGARRTLHAARMAMIDAALAGDDWRTKKAAHRVLGAIKQARKAFDSPRHAYVHSWHCWQALAERALLCDKPAAPVAERVRQLVPSDTPRDREHRGFGPEGRPIETEGGQHAA